MQSHNKSSHNTNLKEVPVSDRRMKYRVSAKLIVFSVTTLEKIFLITIAPEIQFHKSAATKFFFLFEENKIFHVIDNATSTVSIFL